MKRIKSAFSAVLVIASLMTSPALAAGTTPLAMVPQVDSYGNQAAGCLLYFYVAGTVNTPQNPFADFGLTQPLGNPLSCDQAGRVPMHWLADGLIHIRLTDAAGAGGPAGNPIIDTTMQVLGPSSGGGGGGGTVDPTTVLSTGDMKAKYGTGPLVGFVRLNGLTIGNATCGCSERANSDTQSLFIYLYGVDASLPVSGGRTGNALNDFNASKQLTLPDWSGRAMAAMDDMGSGPRGVLTSAFYGTSPTVLGAAGGLQSTTQVQANLPNVTLSVSGSASVTAGVNVVSANSLIPAAFSAGTGGAVKYVDTGGVAALVGSTGVISGTTASLNGNVSQTAMATVSPMKLSTFYIKL